MNISACWKLIGVLVCVLLALVIFPVPIECAKKASGSSSPAAAHEPVIEEVTQKQLERILQDKDYVAVYWCKCHPAIHLSAATIVHIDTNEECNEIDKKPDKMEFQRDFSRSKSKSLFSI